MRIPLPPPLPFLFFLGQKIRRRCLMSSIHWVHFVPRIYRGWFDAGVRSRLQPLTSIASSFLVFHHFLYIHRRPFFLQSLDPSSFTFVCQETIVPAIQRVTRLFEKNLLDRYMATVLTLGERIKESQNKQLHYLANIFKRYCSDMTSTAVEV
jgi:hypothetical protein